MIELNGRRLGLDSELAGDYESFHDGAAAIDLSDRGRMRFSGDGARAALNGILTCDVAPLADGTGAYGVALTNKGKVVADVTVYAMADTFLVECPLGAWPNWMQLITKYVNPRMAKRVNETFSTSVEGLFGPDAARIVAGITGLSADALEQLPMYSHLDAAVDGVQVNVARIPDMGVNGYRLMVAKESFAVIHAAAIAAGARVVSAGAAECARIEAGRPLFGRDMDDATIPQEANLEALGAISYTKGCYTGQEVVARLHFRGHVNRRLMGLRFEGSTAPQHGASVTSIEGKESGDVRSAVVSPRFGPIALAMVRREIAAGEQVRVRIEEEDVTADVVALPFGA